MYALLYNETNEYLEKVIYEPFIKYFTTKDTNEAMKFDFHFEAGIFLIRHEIREDFKVVKVS